MTRRKMLLAMLALTALPVPLRAENKPAATLYRNPNCDCCLEYAKYLREKFEGCHVMVIGRYAVEGHVPVATLNKLLAEQPDIVGVSLPGMPLGSPGMTGRKAGPFTIYEIRNEPGPAKVFAVE